MAAFASGEADVLVATTVIEVGIDVPNATVMLVENAERFGISQLHQLRGRIGRGEHRGICRLMGPPGSPRLRALAEHGDGFRLAEIDLELRSEGELVGTRQSGLRQFEIAELPQDAALLERARACAEELLDGDPQLREPENVLLGERAATPASAPRRSSRSRRRRRSALRSADARDRGRARRQAAAGAARPLTRPTSDRVREALFAMLGELDGARVLDLFAGSGALGIEALSRGAAEAVFVERDAGRAARAAAPTWTRSRSRRRGRRCFASDALAALQAARRREETYDLLFIDPPYGQATRLGARAFGGAAAGARPGGARGRRERPASAAATASWSSSASGATGTLPSESTCTDDAFHEVDSRLPGLV